MISHDIIPMKSRFFLASGGGNQITLRPLLPLFCSGTKRQEFRVDTSVHTGGAELTGTYLYTSIYSKIGLH